MLMPMVAMPKLYPRTLLSELLMRLRTAGRVWELSSRGTNLLHVDGMEGGRSKRPAQGNAIHQSAAEMRHLMSAEMTSGGCHRPPRFVHSSVVSRPPQTPHHRHQEMKYRHHQDLPMNAREKCSPT